MTQPVDDGKEVAGRERGSAADLDLVFADLVRMRQAEGEKLHTVVLAHVDRIENLATAAENRPLARRTSIRKRLTEQVQRLLETGVSLDRNRLHQEAVLLATRSDIEEELDRIFAHLALPAVCSTGPEPVGRKFDFLAQEFNREVNTLCSKAIDQSLTEIGLELKTVIDQMREQVQNLE